LWWVRVGSVIGLVGLGLVIVYWFFRLRFALAEKGWKYTSIIVTLPWIMGLFNAIEVLLREFAVLQEGGTGDTAWIYTLAALNWIVLPTVLAGIILDAVIIGRQSST